MNKIILLTSLIFSCTSIAQTGSLKGVVLENEKSVPYAKIKLEGTSFGAIADSTGAFKIDNLPYGDYSIFISSLGYIPFRDTLHLNNSITQLTFTIQSQPVELSGVVITGSMREVTLSNSPVKIEVLTPQFFKINPVNSVIEALNTVNGVQEQVNCGVCGTNDIHINGMEGPYTLVLIDGMPIVSGLSTVYGFNGIPTSLIQRVEIIKGPSSTLYGTEAVGGVINIITKNPDHIPLIDFEFYGTSHQEYKLNFAWSPQLSKRVSTSISLDYFNNQKMYDFNQDNFTDIPLNNRLSAFNKWSFQNKNGKDVFNFAARFYAEERFGGTLQWTPDDRGSDSVYGENIVTRRLEIIGSYKPPFAKSWRLDFSGNTHFQKSWYGDVNYTASQHIFFSNLIWEKQLNRRHHLLAGATNKYVIYEDNTASATDHQTYIPGIFTQHEFKLSENFILLSGARLDYHMNHGLIFSPRLSMKKQFGDFTAVRFNYGNGFRQVHLATEDHAFVTGSRDVVILENLNPERSHNVTLNFNQTHTVFGFGNIDVDLFYTFFSNKIVADYEQDPNLIVYENLNGYGITRGVSAAIFQKFKKIPLSFRLGFTWMDVFLMNGNETSGYIREEQLFVPEFSGTFSVGYEWKKKGLSFNYTGKVMGPQHLPTFEPPFERPEISPWYSIQNFQITKKFKFDLEIYAGIKNILNFTQPSPLINPSNPYDDTFDTGYVYAPLQPRRYYFGIRYNFQGK